jgi:phage terminase large subunit-like protein
MVMARAYLERRLARLQRQAELMLFQRRRSLPDAVAIMQASGLTPDPWQFDVLTKHAPRVLMNCCRQSGKSTVAAAIALTEALQPSTLTLVLSPSLRQSQELYRKVRDLYRPHGSTVPIEQESALRLELTNGSRIISLPGTEQKIRGFSGVGLLIIDEAARVPDEFRGYAGAVR